LPTDPIVVTYFINYPRVLAISRSPIPGFGF
jgi:hypothetical protein